MNEQQALGWLGRKVGWGFSRDQLSDWLELGVDSVVDQLVDPDDHGMPTRPDPFEGLAAEFAADQDSQAISRGVIDWIEGAIASPRPLETFMEFFWMDYFAVSVRSVRPPTLMFTYMDTLARHGLGNFGELLRAVTTDGAMLVFLDGATNTAESPNENYGRELLELYSVGVGAFDEDDVKAAASALTGWRVNRRNPDPRFVSGQHNDSPQTLLGVEAVHDVDTVIDAVVADPATSERVVDKLAVAILGPDYDREATNTIVANFAGDLELRPVVRGLIELGVQGAATPSILEPMPWMATATRFTGATPRPGVMRTYFRSAGQMPLFPPNVGGFPEPDAYLSTSSTIARFNMASELATRARSSALDASEDVDDLAFALGLVDGFSDATSDAVGALPSGADRIAAALASPDLLVV